VFPVKIAYDIGAHKGSYTDYLLSKNVEKIHTFEPNQSLFEQLQTKYADNDKVVVYNCLVGDKNEKKEFYLAKYHHTISTASKDFLEKSRFANKKDENNVPYEWLDPVITDCYKLDTLIKNTGHPDLIKIDAEGFEVEILSGLTQVSQPVTVTFEVHEEFLDKFKTCINHLHDIGFNQFGFSQGDNANNFPSKLLDFNEFYEEINLFFPTFTKDYFGMAFALYK